LNNVLDHPTSILQMCAYFESAHY